MMSWALFILLCFAGALAFLIGLAIGAVSLLLPRPRRFGFDVRNDE